MGLVRLGGELGDDVVMRTWRGHSFDSAWESRCTGETLWNSFEHANSFGYETIFMIELCILFGEIIRAS